MVLQLLGGEKIGRRVATEEGRGRQNKDAASVSGYLLCTGVSSLLSSPNMFDPPIQRNQQLS